MTFGSPWTTSGGCSSNSTCDCRQSQRMTPVLVAMVATAVFALGTLVTRSTVARSYPEAFVVTALGLLVVVQVSSEVLGALHLFTTAWIGSVWLVIAALLVGIAVVRREAIPAPQLGLGRAESVGYGAVAVLSALTFATGLLVAPNNWDSLTYHLSRAAHWLQQGSLDLFEPAGSRENTMSPLADLTLAHLIAADGTARFAFLGQWAAGIVVLVGVGLLAQHLFDSRRVVLLAVISAATVPMLLSQMSTTQADLLAGVPVAAAIVAWRWVDYGRWSAAAALVSVALATSVALKTTSALLVLPWFVLVVVVLVKARARRWVAATVGLAAMAGLALNGGHAWRLLAGQSGELSAATDVLNRVVSAESVGVNLLRDFATAVVVPIPSLVALLQDGTSTLAHLVGWDIALPAATFGSGYAISVAWTEDHAGAPWHVLLALVAIVVLLLMARRRPQPRALILIGVLVAQVLAVAVVMRWQPWINRFTFLIVVFAAPLIGWLISRWARSLQVVSAAALVGLALGWILLQPNRGLAGTSWIPDSLPMASSLPRYDSPLTYDRFEQLFMQHPPTATAYADALVYAESLAPSRVVMTIGGDWWEYPIWYWFAGRSERPFLTHKAGGSSGTTVVICTTPCPSVPLEGSRTFKGEGPPTPSVDEGPELVVGLLRQSPDS